MSVLGLDLGYTVKYNPLPSGVPQPSSLGTASGKGLYLTAYPSSRPITDTVSPAFRISAPVQQWCQLILKFHQKIVRQMASAAAMSDGNPQPSN